MSPRECQNHHTGIFLRSFLKKWFSDDSLVDERGFIFRLFALGLCGFSQIMDRLGGMMMRFLFILSVFVGAVMVLPSAVYAQDADGAQSDAAHAEDEAAVSVRERVKALVADLSDAERTHFYAIYDSHNLIRVVKDVENSVGEGVDKCVQANPEMKADLRARYKDWKASIDVVLKEAKGNVDNMIAVQDYTKPREIRKVLKFVDKKRKEKQKEVKKVPVTSPEACEFLLNKMDETEENLTGLLRSTLVSVPQALQDAQDAEKAAAKEAAEKAAEDGVEK